MKELMGTEALMVTTKKFLHDAMGKKSKRKSVLGFCVHCVELLN
jgi:hypothetical protein